MTWLTGRAQREDVVNTPLFAQQRDNIMRLLAAGIGCAPGDFDRDQLTIADRPESTPWYTALAVRFGVGAVVSVEPRFRDYVERNVPTPYFHALRPELLQRMADECSTASEALTYHPPSICWGISQVPASEAHPSGYRLELMDRERMNGRMSQPGWVNGIGTEGQARQFRNQFAIALLDETGEPAAIAGAFLTYGMYEIGVDVARDHRGRGFGTLVVQALTREILDRGETPLYGCAADNIRSQRTALASGFLPVYSDAAVGVVTPE